ncbi:lymphocyte function-associated antigen 3 isoform X2 [Hyaena hyaena]|uniref:lymphocyte function-associated antigen 3 isoform X2 n=2 Tax=Hyaena hyaena TaxID=95912 RepID=UPI0019226CF5|nr:lymphocyte function-associated antigen 3 isoform X2 [Hyaena hyaena]
MAAGSAGCLAAGSLCVACLVLYLGFPSCATQTIYGAVNHSVTLYTSGSVLIKEIMWKKGKDKVIQWDEEDSHVKAYPPFIDRVHLDLKSGNLTIFNLTLSDEDWYEVDSLSITNTKFYLQVIEPLPSPTLNCSATAEKDIMVSCMVPESYNSRYRKLINYSWNCFSAQCQNRSNSSEVFIGREADLSQEIQCIISDPLSRQTSSLRLATCVPDNSRVHFMIIPAVFLVVILVVGFLLYGKDHLKCCGERARTELPGVLCPPTPPSRASDQSLPLSLPQSSHVGNGHNEGGEIRVRVPS